MKLVKVFFIALIALITVMGIISATIAAMTYLKEISFAYPTPIGFMLYFSPMLVLMSLVISVVWWAND